MATGTMETSKGFGFAKFVKLAILGAGVLSLFQWFQMLIRLRRFFDEYHGERGFNHIGEDIFVSAYIMDAVLIGMSGMAIRIFRQKDRVWRNVSFIVAISVLGGWITLFAMHRFGIVVGYDEFIRHWKGIT